MSNDTNEHANPAEQLFAEGMRHDLNQDNSPAAATLARVNFHQAASMGHTGALRALALMTYEGRGGERNQKLGLLQLWAAYRRGDHAALEEFADLLASFGDDAESDAQRKKATHIAEALNKALEALGATNEFMDRLRIETGVGSE